MVARTRNRANSGVDKYDSPPAVVRNVIRTFVAFPFWCAILIVNSLRESLVVQQFLNLCLDAVIYIIQRILQDPTINDCLVTSIASGINVFIQQPDLDKLLLHMATSLSKTQPDIARQQGQDFPMIVSSFVQGMIHAVKTNNNNNQSKLNIPVGDSRPDAQQIFRTPSRGKLQPIEHCNENEDIISVECINDVDVQETVESESEKGTFIKPGRLEHLIVNSTFSTSPMSSSENLTILAADVGSDTNTADAVTPIHCNISLTSSSETECYPKPTLLQPKSVSTLSLTTSKSLADGSSDCSASSSIFHFPMFRIGNSASKNRKDACNVPSESVSYDSKVR